jgi:transcriptional regulator with XRE-family HTH domain
LVVGQKSTTPGIVELSPWGVEMEEKTTSQQLLGYNLKATRNFLGLSQMRLAEMCNLSTNFISELEGGKAWVSAESLDKIASTLGIVPHALFLPISGTSPTDIDGVITRCLQIVEDGNKRTVADLRQELLKSRE